MRTISDVRYDLNCWGKFWSNQEVGQGYASKSNVEALRENLRMGCSISGTSHLVNHMADNIRVPDHIKIIDERINILTVEQKLSICDFYKRRKAKRSRLLNAAERELM